MSLKAKIEAVIYASEEPVTLVQLAGLLGQEAQAELDALAARQATLQILENPDAETREGDASAGGSADAQPIDDETVERMGHPDGADPVVPESTGESAAEKRAARERERKVREYLRELVDELMREYQISDRGLEVREVAGGFRMATKPEYHDAVRGFVKSLKPPLKLSLQALETLAVVAYKQPVTAPEVSEIRGVDSGGVLGSLMARKLITTAGRKQVIGRPILYKTTKDFLLRFGLKDVAELPSIEEFEKMAGELADAEPVQEEIPMPETTESSEEITEERITHENLLEEQHATEPQADGDSEDLEPEESNRPSDELPAVDGRESGLPPTYDRPGDDPSEDEAAIQSSAEGE
jgi:segregation and condensation protein B